MRSPIKEQLFKTFQREMERQYPSFALTEVDVEIVGVWSRCLTPQLYIFLKVMELYDEDSFVVEVGWSDKSLYPWEISNHDLKFDSAVWWNRLSRLWHKGVGEPVWELAPEDRIASEARSRARLRNKPVLYPLSPPDETLLERIEPTVIHALKKFQKYGVPIFNQLGNHRGLGDVL